MIPSEFEWRQPPPSPRPKELWKKLNEATRLIREKRWRPADLLKMQANWDDLEQAFPKHETSLPEDQHKILLSALNEIRPEHYVGGHPPEPAREKAVRDQAMWEFKWKSAFFEDCEMYIKFCLCGDEKSRRLYMLSLHINKLL